MRRTDASHLNCGKYFDDFEVGDVYRSRMGRTVTDADNIWFTCLTHNTNQIHFNVPHAAMTRFQRPLVNSTFTLALITGLSVPDTSENATANLGWREVQLPRPVFVGDTLWAETEVLEARLSRSQRETGIVTVRTRGLNQDGEEVIVFDRTFMIPTRSNAPNSFPSVAARGRGSKDPTFQPGEAANSDVA